MKDKSASMPANPTWSAFRSYGPELQSFLLRRIHRSQDAEDVVQEVFLRLLRVKDGEFVRNPRAYIYGIALHVVREFRMRDLKAGTAATLDPQELVELVEERAAEFPDQMSDELHIRQQLERALLRLPPAHRAVFLMHKRDGYSYQEIAERLQISVHTVDKYLVQAKVKILTMDLDR